MDKLLTKQQNYFTLILFVDLLYFTHNTLSFSVLLLVSLRAAKHCFM